MQTDNAKSKQPSFFRQSTPDHLQIYQFEDQVPLMATQQLNPIIKLLCSKQHNESEQLAIANLAKKLDLYACIWEKTPNLSQELRETLWTLRDIDKCLYTGQLYLVQARYKHALQVLTEGIHNFSPDAPEYVLIKKLMQLARHRLRRYVDVITQSPYDILSTIISYLDPDSRSVCAYVSRSWRSRVLGCEEAWRILHLSGSSSRKKTKALGLFPAVAQHINTLTLHNDTKE
ncbi:hypothetical protein BJV82DRAFT_204564 [Fennellomyces sp. T-0311]|nr:hypothetical protein BJV82DRAFT_204564 [Fennellomyces sp. T-0311]